jgi:pimeloyl-ACP methyl ester carboxylesterase
MLDHIDTSRSRVRWAGLAGRERAGEDPAAQAFVLLHGLTFDRRMWDPVLEALPAQHRAIAFDLPGHGGSPMLPERGLAPVADAIRQAVLDADLEAPVMVGHSIGGPLASIYASRYPASGVISVDAPLRLEPFAHGLDAVRAQFTGPGFAELWPQFRASMHIDRVHGHRRQLLRAGERESQEVVVAYQADLLERPLEEVVRWRDEGLAQLARAGTPYVALQTEPVDPAEEAWLHGLLPQAEVQVWPVGHHFPHLADPAAFVDLMKRFATPGS